MSLSLFTVSAVFMLDVRCKPWERSLTRQGEGHRILAKYFTPKHGAAAVPGAYVNPFKTFKEQRALELAVQDKTRRGQGDIILYQNHLVLFRPALDFSIFLVGPESENELMLSATLTALHDAVATLLRHQLEKRAILENLDLVVLCLDETIDDGIVLETDSTAIAARVSRPRPDAGAVDLSNITINEQTCASAVMLCPR